MKKSPAENFHSIFYIIGTNIPLKMFLIHKLN